MGGWGEKLLHLLAKLGVNKSTSRGFRGPYSVRFAEIKIVICRRGVKVQWSRDWQPIRLVSVTVILGGMMGIDVSRAL